MRRINSKDENFAQAVAEIRSQFLPLKLIFDNRDKISLVQNIIEEIYKRGDQALCEFTERFDKVKLTAEQLLISEDQIKAAYEATPPELVHAIGVAIKNVRFYQEHIKVYQTSGIVGDGVELRTRYRALERVGICVPGASAPLPSTVIMSAVPAQVAGVKEIVVVCPPRHQGSIHPTILACCWMLDIREVYRVGGAQAVAAMAIGTNTIKPVDKIVGPGNIYVQMAKKLLFGVVDIDSFAGPSEIVVLGDDTTNPRFAASDLIGQAEHDPGSGILVTPSEKLAGTVEKELTDLLSNFERKKQAQRCLDDFGAIIITKDIAEAIDVVNRLAPEHLSVQTKDYKADSEKCITAGAIFVGPYTSEALGDYVAGPSHVLPTGGTARFFSPLNVMDFIRHTSVIQYDKDALKKIYPAIKALTDAEMLPGHQLSAKVRLEQKN